MVALPPKIPEDSSLLSCYVFPPHHITCIPDVLDPAPPVQPRELTVTHSTSFDSEPFLFRRPIASPLPCFRLPFASTAAILSLSAIVGTAIATAIFFAVAHVEQSTGHLFLSGVCDEVKFRLDETIHDTLTHLRATSALFVGGSVPSNETWIQWAKHSAESRRYTDYILFAPRISNDQKFQWEREHNASITSAQEPWYYPIQYCDPPVAFFTLGDDVSQIPSCGAKIRKAATTGRPTAWATRLDGPDNVSWLVAHALPIYYSNTTIANENFSLADGIIESGTKVELLAHSVITYLADYPDVLVAITDSSPTPQILYQNQVGGVIGSGNPIEMKIDSADESWRLICRSRIPVRLTFASMFASLIAVFWTLTTLFAYRINLATRYFEAARAEVSQNKGLLFSTQLKLNSLAVNATAILRAIADPLVLVDHQGYIQYANLRASALFGYTDLCDELPIYERQYKRFLSDISDSTLNSARSGSFTNETSHNNSGFRSRSIDCDADLANNSDNNGMRNIMVYNKSGQGIPAEASISLLGSVKPRDSGRPWTVPANWHSSTRRMSDASVLHTDPHAGVGPTSSGIARRKSSPDMGESSEERQSPCVILFRDISAKVASARELEAAKQSAERECATKTALLNFVSHELRNPLHAIKGILYLLEQMNTSPQLDQWHKALLSQSAVIETIVNDVLIFQSTAFEITRKAFSILQLVQEITEKQALVAKCNGLVLETEILSNGPNSTSSQTVLVPDASATHDRKDEPTPSLQFNIRSSPAGSHPEIRTSMGSGHTFSSEIEEPTMRIPEYVYGDRTRVKEMILNLLMNGMKFMTTGTIKLTVCCSKRTHNWCRLLITVKDMGEGFSEKELEMVFQPFAQGASIAKLHGGTGLCLAIVHDLVESMNGQIGVVSRIGEGTAITVELPMEICHEVPVEFQQDPEHPPEQAQKIHHPDNDRNPLPRPANLGPDSSDVECVGPENSDKTQKPIRVLVVEDNLMIQKLEERQLAKVGYIVETAVNGAEAVAMVTENAHYDLILMDLNMPVMDGVTATIKIRNMGWQGIIVALTANVLKETETECLAKGFNYFLSKPLNLGVLTQHISKTLMVKATKG